jgi:hypothetical protein
MSCSSSPRVEGYRPGYILQFTGLALSMSHSKTPSKLVNVQCHFPGIEGQEEDLTRAGDGALNGALVALYTICAYRFHINRLVARSQDRIKELWA